MTNQPTHHAELVEDLSEYSLPQLQALISIEQDQITAHQKTLGRVSFEIGRRFFNPIMEQMKAKEARSATIDAPDGYKIKGSVSKTVSWDSDGLQTIAGSMSWDEVKHYFKIKFTMAEAMFKALPPGEFKDKVTALRTTKDGQCKIEMIAPKDD